MSVSLLHRTLLSLLQTSEFKCGKIYFIFFLLRALALWLLTILYMRTYNVCPTAPPFISSSVVPTINAFGPCPSPPFCLFVVCLSFYWFQQTTLEKCKSWNAFWAPRERVPVKKWNPRIGRLNPNNSRHTSVAARPLKPLIYRWWLSFSQQGMNQLRFNGSNKYSYSYIVTNSGKWRRLLDEWISHHWEHVQKKRVRKLERKQSEGCVMWDWQ